MSPAEKEVAYKCARIAETLAWDASSGPQAAMRIANAIRAWADGEASYADITRQRPRNPPPSDVELPPRKDGEGPVSIAPPEIA